ncbi:MAG: hypothetical protein KDK62_00920 [Chlamydiia bacterium]|nr:hypothetical protein [Chlamydiia bacterium]
MRLKFVLPILTLAVSTLAADVMDDVFSADDTSTFDLSPISDEPRQGPLTVRSSFDIIRNADFSDHRFKGQSFDFYEWDIDGSYIFYYNPCRREGLGFEAGYAQYHLGWSQNPYFTEDNTPVLSVGLSFFTARAWRWDWKGMMKVNFNTDHWDIQRYANYDLMLWGRFELAIDWGLHTGFVMLTGMKIDRFYPIIGLDYIPNDRWKISAVFPLNFSILYTPNCNWIFSLQSRFWDIRQRAGYTEPLSRALWEYRNTGGEFGITFKRCGFSANVHAGYSFGGQLKIWNSNKKHPRKLDFDAAPYYGGEVAYNF